MSTMISFSPEQSNSYLTESEIGRICPLAFKTDPTNPNVSDKYVQATTIDVVRDMEKLGWRPVQAKQCRHKKGSSGIRSFHMVAFEHPDVKITRGDNVEAMVRVILTNSHDGFNSFKFMCGAFRLVCSNGLIISDLEFANVSIRHINYNFEELRGVVAGMLERIPEAVGKMNTMSKITLTGEQKAELAKEAYKIRKGYADEDNVEVDAETITSILTPMRTEDKKDDLWTVFNVCQEKMIKGGFSVVGKNGKLRKQRSITSIKKDIDYNVRLWEIANKYVSVAA